MQLERPTSTEGDAGFGVLVAGVDTAVSGLAGARCTAEAARAAPIARTGSGGKEGCVFAVTNDARLAGAVAASPLVRWVVTGRTGADAGGVSIDGASMGRSAG